MNIATSRIEYVQEASPKKLPFLHSNFKPSSKFAKSFGGCNRYAKLRQSAPESGPEQTRLPRITYDADDRRTSLAAFGSTRRGARREYPGFAGHMKILRRQRRPHAASTTSRNDSRGSQHTYDDDGYVVFASPRDKTEHSKETESSNYVGSGANEAIPKDKWPASQPTCVSQKEQRLGFRTSSSNVACPLPDNGLSKDIDAMNISENDQINNFSGCENLKPDGDAEAKNVSTGSQHDDKNKEQRLRFAAGTRLWDGKESDGDACAAVADPFSRNFDEKLREIRGKSGVKREKEKRRIRKTKTDKSFRQLGDIITEKRLHELLAPSDGSQGITIKLHS